ncbi:MAG: cation:proton antiporter [Candidatus Altiarchaeota archaeon]|nr:cation:proton antiporter [Candidatus Altiarchaeota archaeon]
MREDIIIVSAFIVLSGFIALELGITAAIVELVAGMLAARFMEFESTEVIILLADIGILILMYVAGLEIDFDLLRQNLKSSLVIGVLSFVLPFVSVFLLLGYIGPFDDSQKLLCAIAVSTTSIAVVYAMLLECGIGERERKTILSAAMVTDVLSMAALGFMFLEWSRLLFASILALFVFTLLFPSFGSRLFRHYKGNVVEFEFRLILLLLLMVAIISERAGIESAIIAFLLGMITSEVVVKHEDLQTKLKGITFGFFAPLFFFSVGLSIDVLDVLKNLPLLLGLLAISFTAKYIGTYLGSRFYLPKLAGYTATIFNSNLTIGVIAATLGLKSGIFNESLYSAVVGAVVLSSIISSGIYAKKEKRTVPA